MRREDPHVSVSRAAARHRFYNELTEFQRAELLASCRRQPGASEADATTFEAVGVPQRPAGPDLPEAPDVPRRSAWSCSDGKRPVSKDIIQTHVGRRGLSVFGSAERKRRRQGMVSKDLGIIRPGQRFIHR